MSGGNCGIYTLRGKNLNSFFQLILELFCFKGFKYFFQAVFLKKINLVFKITLHNFLKISNPTPRSGCQGVGLMFSKGLSRWFRHEI